MPIRTAKHFHVWASACAGASHDVGKTISIDIRRGHTNASCKARAVGKKGLDQGETTAIEHIHLRGAASIPAHNDIGDTVPVHIARGNENPARETWRKRQKRLQKSAVRPIVDRNLSPALTDVARASSPAGSGVRLAAFPRIYVQ